MKGIESEEFSSFASPVESDEEDGERKKEDDRDATTRDHANAPEHPTDANTTSALERGNGGNEEEEEEEEAVRAAQPGTRNETREERKKEKQSVGVEGKNQKDGLRRRRSGRGKNDAKEDKDDDNDVDADDDPNKKLERPRGKRPPMENFIVRFLRILWTYITILFSLSMDAVVFFSPSTKSRHRARGHHHHHHNEKETKVNPTDINDAEFYDFVKSSRQMMMKEIGKEKQHQANNRSERPAAKSRQKAVASLTQEQYEIRLLKARLAELEQASRG
jgi:hypothetical protein